MRRARDALLALLSHDAAGLLIAVAATASFWGVSWAMPGDLRGGVRAFGLALGLLLVMNREKFLFAVQESPMFAIELLGSIDQRLRQLKDCTRI